MEKTRLTRNTRREERKIADKFYDLVGALCVDPESKMKKARSEPELLNINQDDNKMEKEEKKCSERKYFPPTMHKMLH
jgi:hypothetical protein